MQESMMGTWTRRTAGWAALLSLAVMPVFFIPVPWMTIAHAKLAFLSVVVGLGVAAVVLGRFLGKGVTIPKSLTLATSLLIPVAYVISAAAHGEIVSSLFGFGVERDTLLAALLWIGALMLGFFGFENREQVMKAYKALLVLSALAVVFQVVRLIVGPEILTFAGVLVGPSASIVGTWHDFGILLGLTLLLSAAFFTSTHCVGVLKAAAVSSFAASFVGLILVNVKDVWSALAVVALVAAGAQVLARRAQDPGRSWVGAFSARSAILWAAIAVISIGFVAGGSYVYAQLPESLRVAQVEIRPSWKGTFDVAAATYQSAGALFGSGPNTFVRQWGMYKPTGVNETAFWNADFAQGVGFIPTTFITLGLVGVLAWLLFLTSFLWEGGRFLWRSYADISVEPIANGLVAGSLFLWALLAVYPPGPAIIALSFLLTGAALSWLLHSGFVSQVVIGEGAVRVFIVRVATIVLGILVVGAAILMMRSIVSDIEVNRAITIFNTTTDVSAARAAIARALVVQPDNDRAHRAGVELGLIQLGLLANSTSTNTEALREQLRGTIADAIQHGLAAVSQNPDAYQNWLTLARAYEQLVGAKVEGAYERAEQSYLQAIAANPSNPVPHLLLARLALVNNDAVLAKQRISEAIAKKVNYAEAYYFLSQVEAAQGNLPQALDAAAKAVEAAPQEPIAWFQVGTLYYTAGRFDDASKAFEQALLRNANYANALYMLALSYARLGRAEEAQRLLEQVLILNPGNENVRTLIDELSKAPTASKGSAATTTKATR